MRVVASSPVTDPQLILSEYQLQFPAKEKFTEFLKKENEGFQASVGKGVVKILELLKEFPEITRERLAAGSSGGRLEVVTTEFT